MTLFHVIRGELIADSSKKCHLLSFTCCHDYWFWLFCLLHSVQWVQRKGCSIPSLVYQDEMKPVGDMIYLGEGLGLVSWVGGPLDASLGF